MTTSPTGHRWLTLAVLSALVASAGCVRRTVTIHTAPEGATLTLNDDRIGTTPATTDFTWYGTYDVAIRKEGYKTIHTKQRIDPPWYQIPPIDFFAETFTPFTIHDRRQYMFELQPAEPIDPAKLRQQAAEFRDRALFGED